VDPRVALEACARLERNARQPPLSPEEVTTTVISIAKKELKRRRSGMNDNKTDQPKRAAMVMSSMTAREMTHSAPCSAKDASRSRRSGSASLQDRYRGRFLYDHDASVCLLVR